MWNFWQSYNWLKHGTLPWICRYFFKVLSEVFNEFTLKWKSAIESPQKVSFILKIQFKNCWRITQKSETLWKNLQANLNEKIQRKTTKKLRNKRFLSYNNFHVSFHRIPFYFRQDNLLQNLNWTRQTLCQESNYYLE